LIGRATAHDALPALVRQFERFKAGDRTEVPDVPFQMLTSLGLTRSEWAAVARRGSWQMLRMNLNSLARQGVFDEPGMTAYVSARLRDRAEISRARVFPYQLLAASRAADGAVPTEVRRALEDAMEWAIANVPHLDGRVFVCPDVSGSMRSPLTGHRKGATTTMRCVDVAALMTAAIVRSNPNADVLPFEHEVVSLYLSQHDSVMTNAERLASVGGGGTSVSAPLARLNAQKATGNLVVIVSDNESWVDAGARGTATLREWNKFRERNPTARLVLLDLQPYGTTQAAEREDILNIGGFSDQVFTVIAEFAAGRLHSDHWVSVIDLVAL
jgi:60 kDa SS-A/Ro ribonucleoprotein